MNSSPDQEVTVHPSLGRKLTAALNSPLRIRVYFLLIVAAGGVILALWLMNLGADDRRRELAAVQVEGAAADLAASANVQLVALQTALSATDILLASGTEANELCGAIAQDAVRSTYRRFSVFSTTGNLLCSTIPEARDQPDIIRGRAYFQGAMGTGLDQVDGPVVSTLTGRSSIAVAHPLRVGAAIVGVATLSVDTGELLSGQPLPRQGRAVLISPTGATHEVGVSSEAPSSLPPGILESLRETAATTGNCAVLIEGGRVWDCRPIGDTGYLVAVGLPASEVFAVANADLRRYQWQIAAVIMAAAAAVLSMDVLLLRRIRSAYGRIGAGSLQAGNVFTHDEVDALDEWASGAGAELQSLRAEVATHERRRGIAERELLTSIAEAVESRYPFLRHHGDRVGRYSRQIGIRMGITGEDLDLLAFAGQIHDLGKIVIPDAVYLKPASLEPIERTQMQLHATRGAEIAGRMRDIPEQLAEAIRHHHERWDGSGYPDGLSGTRIPLWSRIIAVADAYDAMTEERPYRAGPRSHDEALAILRDGSGTQWDATAVAAFLEVIQTGEVAPKGIILQMRRASPED